MRRYQQGLTDGSEPGAVTGSREGRVLGSLIGPVEFRDDGTAATDTVVGTETREPST